MGIENMRRWPTYIVFSVCILLTLSLFNSWRLETELRNKISDVSTQLQECSGQLQLCNKHKTQCLEESLALQEQRDGYVNKMDQVDKQKSKLTDEIAEYKSKASKAQLQVNRTLVDVELCKTELQSLKNLQLSKSATLETLRLEKETLTSKLQERREKIEELEKEIQRLKSSLTTKSNPSSPPKVTPVGLPPKQSPAIGNNNPINEPVLENDAKEEFEDNVLNEPINDFDQQN